MSIKKDGNIYYSQEEVGNIMFNYIRESANEIKKEIKSKKKIYDKTSLYV